MNRIRLRQGDTLLLRTKGQASDGRLLKPGPDVAVRILAWEPGSDPHTDEPAREAPCSWNRLRRSWEATFGTADWDAGVWLARTDAAGFDASGSDWLEVEIMPCPAVT